MFKVLDLDIFLQKYDIIYNKNDIIELKKEDNNFKYPITLSGIVRNLDYKYFLNYNYINFDLYISFLSDCFEKHLKCNYDYKMINDYDKEIKNNIFDFLKENINKKILIQGLLDFQFYKLDENNNELFKICFNVKNVSYTRYNLIMNKLQKHININLKKDINRNNINNIGIITDLTSDEAFIFQQNIDKRYKCFYFDLNLNNKELNKEFKKTLNLISYVNKNYKFDLIIILYDDLPLNLLYKIDTYNIIKQIFNFSIPFCSIITYKNKHFNNEELVLSKFTSFDFIDYHYALKVLNQIIHNNHRINTFNYTNISKLILYKSSFIN